MLTAEQLKICNELVELYKAQLTLVEPTNLNAVREWNPADIELYHRRAERVATLQRQLVDFLTVKVELRASRIVHAGTWGDR